MRRALLGIFVMAAGAALAAPEPAPRLKEARANPRGVHGASGARAPGERRLPSPGKVTPSMARNSGAGFLGGGRGGPIARPRPMVACTENFVLNSGVPFSGTTVGYPNNISSYPPPFNLWNESGPEVIHKITLTQTADLRAALLDVQDGQDLDVFILRPCNSDNLLWGGDNVAVYENAPAGDYYVVVDGYQGSAGTYTLMVAAAAGILLVDDDNSSDAGLPDIRSYYTGALSRMGYTYTIWDVGFLGSPDETTLYNTRLVMWFCGGAWQSGTTLTTTDQNNLAGFVYSGGRLYLEGQDILYDLMNAQSGRIGDGTFMGDWMNVNAVTQDIGAPGATAVGAYGDPIGDDLAPPPGSLVFDVSNTPYNQFTDALWSRYGEPAFHSSDNRPAAIRYSNGISRTLFLAFSPANDPSTARADALVDRAVRWLTEASYCFWGVSGISEGAAVSAGANGIPDPGETVTISLTVYNNDTVSHNVKAFLGSRDPFVAPGTLYNDYGAIAAGGSKAMNFTFTVSAGTSVGYELNLLFNVVLNDAGNAFCHSTAIGMFVGQPQILLVKDEELFPNTTGVDAYTAVLTQLGYTYGVWDTARFGSPTYNTTGLPNDRMANYWSVVWFTGADFLSTLSAADETEISLFLDAGKRLVLSSQDYLWEKMGGVSGPIASGFPLTHLRVNYVSQDVVTKAGAVLAGAGSDVAAASWLTEFSAYNLPSQVFANFADSVEPVLAAGARSIFQWDNGAGTTWPMGTYFRGVSATPGAEYRLVFMPFALENVQDGLLPNAKWRLMQKIFCIFQQGAPNDPPPCGYYAPPADVGETIGVNAARNFVWPAVNRNTLGNCNATGEGTLTSYRVHRAATPNPASWTAETSVNRAEAWYDPSGDALAPGGTLYYRAFSVDRFGAVSCELNPQTGACLSGAACQ